MNRGQNQSGKRHHGKLNRRFLVALSLILLLGIACGVTIAYIIAEGGTVANSFTPGEVLCSVDNSYNVTNEGNVDAYLRAAVIVNWKNSNGDVSGIAPKKDINYTLAVGDGWFEGGDGYYYYEDVVAPKQAAATPVVTVSNATGTPDGFSLDVQVLGEAIQSEPAEAVQNAWPGRTPVSGS